MKTKSIALIAHDQKKDEMLHFARRHFETLRHFRLIATGSTGALVEKIGLEVKKMQHGPMGGDAQIATMIVSNELHGLFFLRDPLHAHPHESDILMLLRLADVHNIPTATNMASAHLLIHGLTIASDFDLQRAKENFSEISASLHLH